MKSRVAIVILLECAAIALAQESFLSQATFENRPALVVSNDKLELTVMAEGGAFARLIRRDDPERLSPLWEPARAAREDGNERAFGSSLGHFVCVDGFGAPSAEERAAGFPGHGEAHLRPWRIVSSAKHGAAATVTLAVELPLAHETLTRTIRMVDGESVIWIGSELESHLAFDRVVSWTEHATIGAPFLEPEVTAVDLPAKKAVTRPAGPGQPGESRRLIPGREFDWPLAPAHAGGTVDLRAAPRDLGTTDIVTVLVDDSRDLAYVTAVHPGKRVLFGYLFRVSDYPWLQIWEYYRTAAGLAGGLEFGTQPFGQSRRLTVDLHTLLGAPAYRWLPAKSTMESRFLMFYTQTPADFRGVGDVKLEAGTLIIGERGGSRRIELMASLPL